MIRMSRAHTECNELGNKVLVFEHLGIDWPDTSSAEDPCPAKRWRDYTIFLIICESFC